MIKLSNEVVDTQVSNQSCLDHDKTIQVVDIKYPIKAADHDKTIQWEWLIHKYKAA